MRGLDWDDPSRVQTWEDLIDLINEVGFLPLFKNEVDGFSVEENTGDLYWWTGDEEQDPWEWRCLMARSGKVAYGKFFGKKAGFGKGGEKNFEGTVTDLQMGGYLLIRDFRQRINKRGAPYGWPLSIYTTPEALWGYDHISSAYSVDPAESKTMIYEQVGKNFPDAAPGELDAVLGWTR